MPLPQPRAGDSLGFHTYPSFTGSGTLGNPETIIWSSIQHLCSRNAAEAIAWRIHNISSRRDRAAVAANLKLYIQQASEFYHAASVAKPNTAPLIYYYAFLNLAKALCELDKPRLHQRAECYSHGMSWRPNPRRVVDLKTERVTIARRGMWHALWEALVLKPCPAAIPTKLPVSGLFSYCPEVSEEFLRVFGSRRLGYLELEGPNLLLNKNGRDAWLTFSVTRSDLKGRNVSAPRLLGQIATPRSTYIEVRSSVKESRKFESAVVKTLDGREDPWFALQADVAEINPITILNRDGNLQYFVPIRKHVVFPLPQVIVSYTILFWLGSLVRYDPHSVRWLMDSEYWVLIDGFMSQSRIWLLELFEWALYRTETTLIMMR